MSKKIEHKCKNCRLFDPANSICRVIILWNGEKINLPVEPNDDCFFENTFTAINENKTETFVPADEIKQVKIWVENPETGEKTNKNGKVKIEYPEDFFGKPLNT